MKVWVARDKNKRLCIFSKKPKLASGRRFFMCSSPGDECFAINHDDPLGEGVTFENSPQQVELIKKASKGG